MSESTNIDLRYVANLARIELTDEEIATFEPQLEQILAYVEKLSAIDVSDLEPMAHANPVLNVMRADVARPSLSQEEALLNAPQCTSDQFIVPKVVE